MTIISSSPVPPRNGSPDGAHPAPLGDGANRRLLPRFPYRTSLEVVPVRLDGRPDWEQRMPATIVDVSGGGVGVELNTATGLNTSSFMLVSRDAPGVVRVAGIEAMHSTRLDANRMRLGGKYGGVADEILAPAKLLPVFRPETLEVAAGLPDELLRYWGDVGVLRASVSDRVQLCPQCHGLPTFRPGCRRCGSGQVNNDQLIHHFACAHVGLVKAFETHDGLVCPKCRMRRLVVGSDYEYLPGPYRCQECHWSDAALEQVGQCLRCGFRFPVSQAYLKELTSYHVDRLDLLALAQAPA